MNRTDLLVERDAAVLSETLKVRFFPLVVERAQGCHIWDIEGREYLDFMAGWAVANTGYGNPEIKKAVFEQLDKVSFSTLTAIISEPSIELAEQLLEVVPGRGRRKVWYGLSGSDASDAVAKLVPLAQKRPRMVSYIGGYHGQTGGSAALSGHTAQSRVMSGNVVKVPYPYPYRCPLGHEDAAICGKACLTYLEDYIFRTICPPQDVAGLIVEAVQSDGGDIVPPDGYLQGVQALCRKHGILFCLDEVKIGFGRTGKMWGFQHSGLEPDVVVLGKAMGSGFIPISAVVAPAEVLDVAPAINMYTTAGNPAAATAGLATLKYIKDHDLVGKAQVIGDRLLAGFKELQKRHPLIGEARGSGMILGIELVSDRKTKEPAAKEAAKVAYRAFELGLIVFYGGIYSNVLEITPPLTMTPQEADQGITILDQALRDVESGSFSDEKLGATRAGDPNAEVLTAGALATDPAALRHDVVTRAQAAELKLVRFLYVDTDGIIRSKSTSIGRLADRLETGIGLTVAMQAMTMLDHLAVVEGMGPVGEIRLMPDPATFVVAPYTPKTGVVHVDMVTLDGEPYDAYGRVFLKRMIDRAAKIDLEIVAAFEPEWSLARRDGETFLPVDDSGCFTTYGMNNVADVIIDIVEALEAQGIPVEQYYAELGWGQQELPVSHAPALQAADRHIHYRETIRGVAFRHGLYASFAPKPWGDQAGNGCHIHFSAWNRGRTVNRFHDAKGPYGLSALANRFMAGVLEHLPALVALTCASVNSYRRLQPQMWASAYRVWGPDNREAALRVASSFRGHEADSTNVELKASDSSANPYIALGGLIAAGLDGIERGLELPPPVMVDPHTLTDEERRAIRADRLPQSLGAAVENLHRDRVLAEALGGRLLAAYTAVKKLDVEDFANQDENFEFRQHIYKY